MKNRIEPWRLIVGILSIIFIIVMWVVKDVGNIYASLPKEQLIPVIFTSVCVTLLKASCITLGVIILKKFINKQ